MQPDRNERTTPPGVTPRSLHVTRQAWRNMVSVNTRPSHRGYKSVGGRGLKFEREWLDFSRFVEDVGYAPPGGRLMRLDPRQGFVAGNVGWRINKRIAAQECALQECWDRALTLLGTPRWRDVRIVDLPPSETMPALQKLAKHYPTLGEARDAGWYAWQRVKGVGPAACQSIEVALQGFERRSAR